MSSTVSGSTRSSLGDQFQAIAADAVNRARHAAELEQLRLQDAALGRAEAILKEVRDFIAAPDNILGNERTKHGEIAEQVEVGTRRARDVLDQQAPTASFDGIKRTAAADYQIDGTLVQSKFINGVNNSLDHVLKHMDKYKEFGRDGSFYHIPKDQHELIEKLLSGQAVPDLNTRSKDAILAKVAEIEKQTGLPFREAVQPAGSTYAEVQQGKVGETLDRHEQELRDRNEERREQIKDEHQASLADGARAVAGGAAVGAAVSLVSAFIRQYREQGRNPFKGDYTLDDWKAVGIDTAKGGAIGGVTAGAVYALTNYAEMSAPLAGSFVSAVKGLAPLVAQYRAGVLPLDVFLDQATFICADVAIVGLCTAAGQTLIPIPILGAVLGSIAGKILVSVLDTKLSGVAKAIAQRTRASIAALDEAYDKLVRQIERDFERLGALTVAAFDLSVNESLVEQSIALARMHGVDDSALLKSKSDLHAFMLD